MEFIVLLSYQQFDYTCFGLHNHFGQHCSPHASETLNTAQAACCDTSIALGAPAPCSSLSYRKPSLRGASTTLPTMASKSAISKSTRIKIMIGIDTAFFLLELISGFVAHSLALTADAFHMLNDIISLIIGLWAVVASQKETTDEFTFGWVRAEILGAFFNAVFLIALCVSIILEALTRLVEPPEITQPKLILIVGTAGLISNLLGFVVLGGHGHDHGHADEEEGHDHEHGHSHSHSHSQDIDEERRNIADESGPVEDVYPDVVVGKLTAAAQARTSSESLARGRRLSAKSQQHSRFTSIDDMSIHPSSFRQDIIAAAGKHQSPAPLDSESSNDEPTADEAEPTETSPLLNDSKGNNGATAIRPHTTKTKHRTRRNSSVHAGHNHTLPQKAGKTTGHNHADMGMNAMMLHVLGDALGNVGVIATALVIWLTEWPGKHYADPAVSLFITLIILKTSIPLTLATSRILLQATPENISIKDIRQDIERLPGVVSCHHIHVWQLSDTKIVASMHLQVEFPINTHSGEKYMQLAKRARNCLHEFGIHSATIQPEFCLDQDHEHLRDAAALTLDGQNDPTAPCLLECIDDCQGQSCCTAEGSSKSPSVRRASNSSHTAA
ncbi:zinc homeostasis factor 1 [Cordyceps militaris CM01]|uniref:Zinc homeostasis factor 1 n=1 Tax=Cordyceps militaris (strain CM01) TaxID=983644 RepID=G3JNS5_CORMM|nr:zinc homeostasis factor 1 [Cordyceps militaris CM01]EGX89915.1 zinc homeostasis factor 1 [Cordyceps militaris CM01]